MKKTLPALVCVMLLLSTASLLDAQFVNLAGENSRWPPFTATIDGPFRPSTYNDPPTVKSVSLERFAKFGKLNKFIRAEKLSVITVGPCLLRVKPQFRFAGPQLDSRRIEVEVQAVDQTGQVLSKAFARCSDARIVDGQPLHAAPSTTAHPLPFNEPVFDLQFPVGIEPSVARIEVEFREP